MQAGDSFLQVYLLLGADNYTLTIHMVSCYPTLPGVATPWDGMCFGFIAHIMGLTAQSVEFPGTTTFKLVPTAVCVPTLVTMEAQCVAAGTVPFLLPFSPADANMELIQT